ncbi:MAG TPA: hypothetical protein VF383_16395, partial [Candidatus Dormibacteraeota bacterium]
QVKEWEAAFVRFMRSDRPSVLEAIEVQKALDDSLFERLKAATSTFNHQFGVEGYSEVADQGAKSDLPTPAALSERGGASPQGGEVKAKPKAAPGKKAAK